MPTWKELDRFCKNDGWDNWKSTDHKFYRKDDEYGNPRMTKVSHGTGEIPKHLWQEILNKQLRVTKEYFNSKI